MLRDTIGTEKEMEQEKEMEIWRQRDCYYLSARQRSLS